MGTSKKRREAEQSGSGRENLEVKPGVKGTGGLESQGLQFLLERGNNREP